MYWEELLKEYRSIPFQEISIRVCETFLSFTDDNTTSNSSSPYHRIDTLSQHLSTITIHWTPDIHLTFFVCTKHIPSHVNKNNNDTNMSFIPNKVQWMVILDRWRNALCDEKDEETLIGDTTISHNETNNNKNGTIISSSPYFFDKKIMELFLESCLYMFIYSIFHPQYGIGPMTSSLSPTTALNDNSNDNNLLFMMTCLADKSTCRYWVRHFCKDMIGIREWCTTNKNNNHSTLPVPNTHKPLTLGSVLHPSCVPFWDGETLYAPNEACRQKVELWMIWKCESTSIIDTYHFVVNTPNAPCFHLSRFNTMDDFNLPSPASITTTDNDQEKVCESIEDIIEAYEAKIREKNNVLG